MSTMPDEIYCFGPYRLNVSERTLFRGNERCPLTPTEFEILRALARARGTSLNRHILIDQVWPKDRPANPEANLYQHLRSLKRKLRSYSTGESWIRNVHGRGYELLGGHPVQNASRSSDRSASTIRSARIAEEIGHLVGRETELRALHEALDRSSRAGGLLLNVVAEPGAGKTALVESFLEQVHETRRAGVGAGRCRLQLQRDQPYQAWLDILSRFAASPVVKDLLQSVAIHWWQQLEVPEIPLPGGATKTSVLLREMERFLAHLTETGPLVLFFDDLHWADIATIDLLNQLMPVLQKTLVIAAYRPSDMNLGKNPYLSVEAELKMHGLCRDLVLPDLPPVAVRAYLDLEFPGHEFPLAVARALHEASGGNALCLHDMVEHAVRLGWIVRIEDQWRFAATPAIWRTELPDSVAAMAAKKLEELDEVDRHLLWVSSLQGVTFDSLVAAQASAMDSGGAENRLANMSRRHRVLRLAPEEFYPAGGERYEFTHVLYFDALQHMASSAKRAEFSRRTAESMISVYGENAEIAAPILARLWEEANAPERAVRFCTLAATRALRLSAYQQALDLAVHAISLAALVDRTPELIRCELELLTVQSVVQNALHGFDYQPLEAIYRKAQAIANELGDQSASMRADVALWTVATDKSFDEGLAIARRLVSRARASNSLDYLANAGLPRA